MHWVIRVFKRLGQFLLGFFLLIVVYAVFALGLGLLPVHERMPPKQAPHEIILFTTGIHLDICFPVVGPDHDWRDSLGGGGALGLHENGYVSFGWGDSAFFVNTPTWGDLEVGTTLGALLIPTPSTMHVTAHQQAPLHLSHATRIPVTEAQWQALAAYVTATLARSPGGALKPMDCCGYYGPIGHQFYEAAPNYHAFHTCNDWVNRGLKQAGIRSVVWTPVDRLILRQFE